MKLKIITALIITINVLLLIQDIPPNIMILTIGSLGLSFLVSSKKAKTALKIGLLITGIILLRFHFKTLLVTECGVSFVLILAALKFWELDEERDHFNMFLILSLCECCVFLLNPTFVIFSFGLAKMLFYFYYILKMRNYDISLLNPKRLLLLVTPSIILSLILFYTFPRFTQGFINTNDLQYIVAGGNSKIDFKQLGPLSTSSETAFKAYGLENSNLPFKLLYWKTAVLWNFSNQEWTASNNNLRQQTPILTNTKLKYDIEVFQDLKDLMPVLDGSSSIINSSLNFNSYSDGSYKLKTISRSNLNYSVVGNYGDRLKVNSDLMDKKGLRLRSTRVEEIKKAYFEKASNSPIDEERLRELINIFKFKIFEYSTTPPLYSSVEDFLLTGKSGYCSHFAAGFTYLARAYNLPARMVVGYLGGQFNPYDNSVIIKELDAHAWVEVFIQSRGWVKIDPTSLVAPARMNMSAEEFNNSLNPYITILNFKINRELLSFASLNEFSLWLDSLNTKFSTNILTFDRDKQLTVLRALTPGNLSVGWIFSLSLSTFLFIFWLIFYLYGKKKIDPNYKRYLRFLKKMQSRGLTKAQHETISQFHIRCLKDSPSDVNYIDREVGHYINSFYK
jgi:transglutaminase-like putative cysteine protease